MSIVLVGSTSGSITLQEPAVAGTTVLDLPAVSGTILTTTSPKSGNVLQVVSTTTTSTFSGSSGGYVSTGLSASITPSASSSKILARVLGGNIYAANGNTQLYFTLYRGATNLQPTGRGLMQINDAGNAYNWPFSLEILDSPATTSSTTYTLYGAGNNTYAINSPDTCALTITLMEIAA
jgi:hypothetical protein